jgi:hypothetical protein
VPDTQYDVKQEGAVEAMCMTGEELVPSKLENTSQ